MNLTRRSFLGGLLAITAVAIVNPPKFNIYPVLYMNGEDDDSPALQAMLDGKPYIVEGELIKGTKSILGGEYFLHSTLEVNNDHVTIAEAIFVAAPNFRGPMIRLNGDYGVIANSTFDGRNMADHAIEIPHTQKFLNDSILFIDKGDNIRAATPLNTDYKF